jgi:transcriptional regulator with XRE-family HTH domain
MQINTVLVRAERERRAWSQEQLAGAAGVSLRTIQRVEASGMASGETVQALAAVFECEAQSLRMPSPANSRYPFWLRTCAAGAALAVLVLSVILVGSWAHAGEIALDVVMGNSEQPPKVFKLITEEGQQTEARVDRQLRVVLVPTAEQGDRIMITAEVYAFNGADYKLLSKPRVLTRDGLNARIQVMTDDGKVIEISIRPQRIWRTKVGTG